MNKEIKEYLENELDYYTKELKNHLEKYEYLIVYYGEKDYCTEECHKQIKLLASKKTKILKLLQTEKN